MVQCGPNLRSLHSLQYDSNKRSKIRKALRYGIEIAYDYTGESVNEFNRLYKHNALRNGIPDYYIFDDVFLKKTFEVLKDNQFMIKAIYDGKCISCAICIHHGDYVHGHIAANDPEYFSIGASSVLYYAVSQWGMENGKTQFHFGGANTDSLHKFKQGFTRKGTCDFFAGKRTHNDEIYNALVDMKRKNEGIKDTSFFPLYRG